MFSLILEIIFWFSLGLCCFTYGIYPIIVCLRARALKQQKLQFLPESKLPSISVIISVYNEANVIKEKLRNLETTNYPIEKIEFLIGSDGSNDKTNEILEKSKLSNLRVKHYSVRRGKGPVLNDLVSSAAGEIIIFTDANTMYEANTVRELVKHFSEPSVGGVCGDLRLNQNNSRIVEVGESIYWKYETFLKQAESVCGTLVGATGGIYAIRKVLYKPLPVNKAVVDDSLIPIAIVEQGIRVIYESEAIAYENTAGSVAGEFQRKVRIGASNFNAIAEFFPLLHPKNGFVSFTLWSHKIIRWFVPFLLIIMFIGCGILAGSSKFYLSLFLIQLGFIAVALIGELQESSCHYFCVDDYSKFDNSFNSVIAMERDLLEKTDSCFTISDILFDSRKAKSGFNYYLPQGVDTNHFKHTGEVHPLYIPDIKKPVIGSFGLITSWVDVDLITECAKKYLTYSFVIIGASSINLSLFSGFKNIKYLGNILYEQLPLYSQFFDVGIIPFKINELTIAANPLKLLEYMAMGIPVVSTDLPEVRKFSPFVLIAENKQQFIQLIQKAVDDNSPERKRQRRLEAEQYSWEAIVENVSDIIETIEKQKRQPIINDTENNNKNHHD